MGRCRTPNCHIFVTQPWRLSSDSDQPSPRPVFSGRADAPRTILMRGRRLRAVIALLLAGSMAGCTVRGASPGASPAGRGTPTEYGYTVVNVLPHDPGAFTEGLVIDAGRLYESTGSFTEPSSVREVDLQSGTILQRVDLPGEYFGEGLTVVGDRLFQLTWKSQKGFVYDRRTLRQLAEFTYTGEGWGLTQDGMSLIMSNGSDELRFLDPSTFQVTRSVRVRDGDRRVTGLNELEFVGGEVYANVFPGDEILRIDPGSGLVVGRAELRGLLDPARDPNNVLNGIAHDARSDRLYVTGKRSSHLFEVRLTRR